MKMPVKLLENLTNEFWDMRAKFKDEIIRRAGGQEYYEDGLALLWFDYPNYYDLSYKVYSRLTSDFVDSLQGDFFYELQENGIKTYKQFFKSKRDLHRHLVRIWKIYGFAE